MYLAKFQQVNSDKFKADKNNNMPFIGEVFAGKSTGSIYNGTMFEREGLKTNKLYLCDNHVDEDYPENVQTRIISEVSLLEVKELRDQLGSPKFEVTKLNNVSRITKDDISGLSQLQEQLIEDEEVVM